METVFENCDRVCAWIKNNPRRFVTLAQIVDKENEKRHRVSMGDVKILTREYTGESWSFDRSLWQGLVRALVFEDFERSEALKTRPSKYDGVGLEFQLLEAVEYARNHV